MGNYIIFLVGIFTSCFINVILLFQFLEERNERVYDNQLLYIVIKVGLCFLLEIINLLNQPMVNLTAWIILFSIVNIKLYVNLNKKNIQRILEISALILILSICETVGVVVLKFIFWKFGIHNIDPIMLDSMNITFSKLVVLIFYYLVIIKLWPVDSVGKFTLTQYLLQAIIIIYSAANLAVVSVVISKATSVTERILLLVNMGCLIFADLYFLFFAKFMEENNQLKIKLRLLEQQSMLQYEYYAAQEKKYNESIKILHDVNKHLKMIEDMYQTKQDEIAITYAQEIGQMLIPLVLEEYTNNPILNIILNDKKMSAVLHNIKFDLEVRDVDLSFMEPIELTTIFGNLLDNAIEACYAVPNNKYIEIKLNRYNDFIAIHIRNSTIPIEKWKFGKPISRKGKNHGIGLLNVENIIKKYDGNMVLEEESGRFSCNIIFNQ